MFNVSSTVEMDFGGFEELTENVAEALRMTADALLSDLKNAQVMPFDTGNLQNENTFVDDRDAQNGVVALISSTPYARRLYFHPEYNFSRKENRAAGGEWFKYYLPGGTRQNFCSEKFKMFYERLCGL